MNSTPLVAQDFVTKGSETTTTTNFFNNNYQNPATFYKTLLYLLCKKTPLTKATLV